MAVSFNGTSGIIDMGNPVGGPTISDGNPFAVAFWVAFNSLSGTRVIVAKGFSGSVTGYQFQNSSPGPNQLFFGSFDGTTHGVTWNSTWTTGVWHHVYGDYSGSGGTHLWRLFIDGIDVSAGGVSDTTGPFALGRDFTVGGIDVTGSPGQFHSGCVADVAVFNAPLTGTEITNLAGGSLRPNTGMSQTLRGYWTLDTDIATQPDITANHNDGTRSATGTSLCGDSPPYGASVVLSPTFTQSPILQVRNRVLSY